MISRKHNFKSRLFLDCLIFTFFTALLLGNGIHNDNHHYVACAFKPGFLLSSSQLSRSRCVILNARGNYGRSSSNTQGQQRSKRQERVGNLIRVEVAQILQKGQVKRTDPIESTLLQKINVVNANVSPDLAQARITVSILGKGSEANAQKRRAYSWLVSSQKMIRYALAQRLSHMKTVPTLTFVLADVGAAVDVMALIEKVSKNKDFKRDLPDIDALFQGESEEQYTINADEDGMPSGVYLGLDFNQQLADDDSWIDEEDEDDDDEDEEYLIDDDENEEQDFDESN